MKCCICECEINGFGHNPEGAAWRDAFGNIRFPNFGPDERCCDTCNTEYVIPGRLYRLSINNNN